MSDLNEAELAELERRLDAAFASARPRRGFEDELWVRLARRAPWWALWRHPGRGPLPALGAVAAVLLIGLATFLVPRAQLGQGGAGSSSYSSRTSAPAAAPEQNGGGLSGPQKAAPVAGGFGALPAPALARAAGQAAGEVSADAGTSALPVTVTASLPSVPARLPVYRYSQPTSGDRVGFAASLRARPAGTPNQYLGSDFSLSLDGAMKGRQEPTFQLSGVAGGAPPAGAPPAPSEAERIADDYLDSHKLRPSWPTKVSVETGASSAVVRYQRQFTMAGLGSVGQIDDGGSPAGLEVSLDASRSVTAVSGPLPLTLESSSYPSRPPAQARDAAARGTAAGMAGATGAGAAKLELNQVRLVYIAVADDAYGYFEPAYLFTGTAASGERRVLVPALDASALRSR